MAEQDKNSTTIATRNGNAKSEKKVVNFDENNPRPWMSTTKHVSTPSIDKTTIVKNDDLDNEIGQVVDDFECVHFFKRGKLTVGTIAIIFQGNFWGFKSNVTITLNEIKSVNCFDPDGIEIITKSENSNGGGVYRFTAFTDRDSALGVLNTTRKTRLKTLSNSNSKKVVHNKEWNEYPLSSPSRKHVRTLSDSLLQTKEDGDNGTNVSNSTMIKEQKKAEKVLNAMAEFSALSLTMRESHMSGKKEDYEVLDKNTLVESILQGGKDNLRPSLEALRKKAFESDCNHVIQDLLLSCDLTTFYNTFLADGAEFSLQAYLSKIGDTVIEVTPWQQTSSKGNTIVTSTRTIHYLHPVNVPMAPPSAKATKQQIMQTFGTHGIYIETCTQVDDVPLTDCFVVDDQIYIEPLKENSIQINANFKIRFTKSTIWKRMIQTTTNGEFSKFFTAYSNMLQDVMTHEEEQIRKSSFLRMEQEDKKQFRRHKYQNNTTSIIKILQENSILCMFILLATIILIQQYFMWKQMSMFQYNYMLLQEQVFELKRMEEETKRNWMKVIEMLDEILQKK